MTPTRRGFFATMLGGLAVALGFRPVKAKRAPITGRCSICSGATVTGQASKLNCGWRADLCNGCNEANDPRYLYLKRGLPEMTWRRMTAGDTRNELTDLPASFESDTPFPSLSELEGAIRKSNMARAQRLIDAAADGRWQQEWKQLTNPWA